MALYIRLLKAAVRSQMQYSWDFILSLVMYTVITVVDFLMVAAILFRYRTVDGWTVYEIAMLSGTLSTAYGLFRFLASEITQFERYMVTGEFDTLLIRPWPTLASLLARGFDLGRLGASLQGIVLLGLGVAWAVRNGAPAWLPFYAILMPLCGVGVVLAVNLAVAAAGFWIIRIEELGILATNAPQAAAAYPISIYPGWLRRILLGIIPVGSIAYLPLSYALGKGGSLLWLGTPVLAAVASLWAALGLWRLGERHYQSTGN